MRREKSERYVESLKIRAGKPPEKRTPRAVVQGGARQSLVLSRMTGGDGSIANGQSQEQGVTAMKPTEKQRLAARIEYLERATHQAMRSGKIDSAEKLLMSRRKLLNIQQRFAAPKPKRNQGEPWAQAERRARLALKRKATELDK